MDNTEIKFRFRQTIVDNLDTIIKQGKQMKKEKLNSNSQLSLFDDSNFDIEIDTSLPIYKGKINKMKFAEKERELLGISITYNPLNDARIFEDIYCNHSPIDLLYLEKDEKNIVIMDYIIDIEHRTSKRGNSYAKIFISTLGRETYFYLFGENYKKFMPTIFRNKIYLFKLTYNTPSKRFNRNNIVIDNIKNIEYIDVYGKIDELIEALPKPNELEGSWRAKNRMCYLRDKK